MRLRFDAWSRQKSSVLSLADLVGRQRGRDARRREDDHPPPRHEGPVRIQQEARALHKARHRERLLLRSPRGLS